MTRKQDGFNPRILIFLAFIFILFGCSDEKTITRDLAGRQKKIADFRAATKSVKKNQSGRSKNQPVIPSKSNLKRDTSDFSAESKADLKERKPSIPSRPQPVITRKAEIPLKKPKGETINTGGTEQKKLRLQFQNSQQVFMTLTDNPEDHRLSWKMLNQMIEEAEARQRISQTQKKNVQQWIQYLEHNSRQLKETFQLPFIWESPQDILALEFVRVGDSLLTPVMRSMWRHCKLNFESDQPGWQVKLISGYRSPAYEAFLFSRSSGSLDEVLQRSPPPNYSRHQRKVPDITVELIEKKGGAAKAENWKSLYQICRSFGFRQGDVGQDTSQGELGFIGVDRLYQSIYSSSLIPKQTKNDFLNAMQRTGFFPSPDGMRVLFAISAQESSISWNPRLNKRKKEDLRKRFDRILANIENTFGGTVSELFFSARLNQEKDQLIKELKRITNPKNRKIREYDFYLWTQKVRQFLNQLLKENRKLTRFGQWLFQIEQFADQIQYEPQTFGLWQINVNHLIERIESYPQLRRRFPEIFNNDNGQWKVIRTRLIDVLSGMPSSVLDRQRAMELIIHTYLQPRYQSHLLGNRDDLMYFIAENVAGEMSTFRAAIQEELNSRVRSHLVLDGDLSFYYPYSTKIDWNKISNTQKAFQKFIQIRYAYFSRPVAVEKLVATLCNVKTWGEMQKSELYRRIMRKKRGRRIFPQIESELYQQTPLTYAKIVMKKSQLF